MRAVEALSRAGRQTWRRWRLILVLYAANLLGAAVVVLPLAVVLSGSLNHSLEGERLLSEFDVSWAVGFGLSLQDASGAFAWIALSVAAVYIVLNTFFAGGVVAVLFGEPHFARACARWFWPMVRLALWTAPAYGIVFAINGGLESAIARASEDSMVAGPWIILGWFRMLTVAVLLLLVHMVGDYARVVMIGEQRRGALFGLASSARLLRNRFFSASAVFFVPEAFGLAFLLLYHGLSEVTPRNSAGTVMTLFLLRQAYIGARMWTRVFRWHAEAGYYASLTRPLTPQPPAADSSTAGVEAAVDLESPAEATPEEPAPGAQPAT